MDWSSMALKVVGTYSTASINPRHHTGMHQPSKPDHPFQLKTARLLFWTTYAHTHTFGKIILSWEEGTQHYKVQPFQHRYQGR